MLAVVGVGMGAVVLLLVVVGVDRTVPDKESSEGGGSVAGVVGVDESG